MKQEILCCSCTSNFAEIVSSLNGKPENRATGEKTKFLVGNSINECNCDHCNKQIFSGDACCAVSTFTDRTPYFGWEDRFIDPI